MFAWKPPMPARGHGWPMVLLVAGFALASAAPAAAQGRVVQTVERFLSPSAVVFTDDGRTLFVANAARGDYGLLAGRGVISRLKRAEDGELTVENLRFIEGLNGPAALSVLGSASGPFPAGTLVALIGGSWIVDGEGRTVADDRERGTGLVCFDPATGTKLGALYLGAGSRLESALGRPLVEPVAMTTDGVGSIYLAEIAGSAMRPAQDASVQPGLIKLTAAAVGALAAEAAPPAGSVQFAPVPQVATDVHYSLRNDALLWVTGSGDGPLGGAVFRLPRGDFSGATPVETVAKELNSFATVVEAPSGTIIAPRNEGDLIFVRGRSRGRVIRLPGEPRFLSPGKPAVTTLADGRLLLVLPEMSGGRPWRQRVHAITLPGNF